MHMHWRMIRSIYRKDLRDAIRDSRVLVAILVPIGIGILYNFMFQDTTPKPKATLAYYVPGSTQLVQNIQAVVGETVQLSLNQESWPKPCGRPSATRRPISASLPRRGSMPRRKPVRRRR